MTNETQDNDEFFGYYVGYEQEEHGYYDYYDTIFDALADYYQAIKDGPGEFNYIEIELGERWNEEMIPLDYHSFTEDDD